MSCVKLSDKDFKSFVCKVARVINADSLDTEDRVMNYIYFEFDEEYVNLIFSTVDSYKQFVLDVEQFLNDRAIVVFNRCKIYGLQSRSNTLNFKT